MIQYIEMIPVYLCRSRMWCDSEEHPDVLSTNYDFEYIVLDKNHDTTIILLIPEAVVIQVLNCAIEDSHMTHQITFTEGLSYLTSWIHNHLSILTVRDTYVGVEFFQVVQDTLKMYKSKIEDCRIKNHHSYTKKHTKLEKAN